MSSQKALSSWAAHCFSHMGLSALRSQNDSMCPRQCWANRKNGEPGLCRASSLLTTNAELKMLEEFQSIVYALIRPKQEGLLHRFGISPSNLRKSALDKGWNRPNTNAAFLIVVAGQNHPAAPSALRFLTRMAESPEWRDAAEFYLSGIERTDHEIKAICSPRIQNSLTV